MKEKQFKKEQIEEMQEDAENIRKELKEELKTKDGKRKV